MHVLWTLFIGLVVGAIAKLLMPGRDPGGLIVTALLGVAGSFAASFIGHTLGFYDTADIAPGVIASVLGAMLLLAIYRALAGRIR